MNVGAGDGGNGRRDLLDADGYFGGGGNGGTHLHTSSVSSTSAAALAAAAAAGVDLGNPKKCRARFGLEQQTRWCKPCRRKKKCVRFLTDAEYEEALKAGKLQSEPSSPTQQGINKSSNIANMVTPKSPTSAFLSPSGFNQSVPASIAHSDFARSSSSEEYPTNPVTTANSTTYVGHFPSPYTDFQRPSTLSHSTLSFLEQHHHQQPRNSPGFSSLQGGGNNTMEEEDDDMKNETLCVFATEASPAGSCHHDNGGGGPEEYDDEEDNFPHIKQEPSPLNGIFPIVGKTMDGESVGSASTTATSITTTSTVSTSTAASPLEKRPIIFSAAALSRCEEPIPSNAAVETGTTAS